MPKYMSAQTSERKYGKYRTKNVAIKIDDNKNFTLNFNAAANQIMPKYGITNVTTDIFKHMNDNDIIKKIGQVSANSTVKQITLKNGTDSFDVVLKISQEMRSDNNYYAIQCWKMCQSFQTIFS